MRITWNILGVFKFPIMALATVTTMACLSWSAVNIMSFQLEKEIHFAIPMVV